MPTLRVCLLFVVVQVFCLAAGPVLARVVAEPPGVGAVQSDPLGRAAGKGEPLGIAYVEGGAYPLYTSPLLSLARGLEARGLIADGKVPAQLHDNARAIWDWLAKHAGGTRIRFMPDAFYSGEWSPEKRAANKDSLLNRVRQRKDIGLILAFGTAAAQDMATNEHQVPTFCLSVTDPVQSGVSASPEDSGKNHVYAQIEPDREYRQLALFHSAFKFSKLGIAYVDTPEGRAFAGLNRIEDAATQLDFELEHCPMPPRASPKADFEQLALCMKKLSESADAVYMTYNTASRSKQMHQLLQPLIAKQVPSFSQVGQEEVALGALMSLSQRSHDYAGQAAARGIEQTLDGVLPRDIPQVLHPSLGLAINIRMAMLVGWEPNLETLAAVDQVFETIGDMNE